VGSNKLAQALSSGTLTTDQLARQLVEMSKIAWRKHAWLQWSLGFLLFGVALLVWAGS